MGKTRIDTVNVLGTEIHRVDLAGALDAIREFVEGRTPRLVVTANVDHVMQLRRDPQFRSVYRRASLVVADGVPLVWASRLFRKPLPGRVNGTDLFEALCARAVEYGWRLFFLGGAGEDARGAAEVLKKRHPGIEIAGTYSPPMGFEKDEHEDRKAVEAVKAAHPDVLFVGLGAPKQEKWICRHMEELNVPVSIGVGVSFSLVAGTVRRAPRWFQRSGLEWFWRLLQEPGRLWKRYLLRDTPFVFLVLSSWLGRSRES